MSTEIKPELSTKSKYWIEKHRYYELKHFCLQYNIWKQIADTLETEIKNSSGSGVVLVPVKNGSGPSNPTEVLALKKVFYTNKIDMVERVCKETSLALAPYILLAVTNGYSYDVLRARTNVPCCRDVYYELYRRFFWLLDKERA